MPAEIIPLNPNLTMEMINKYPDKDWCWDYISLNRFNYKKKQNQINKIKRWYKRMKLRQIYVKTCV